MSTAATEDLYACEQWTDEEAEVLRRYFTNLDGPVFALVNLPELVKGALFARYSRSAKALRRLFLDEFVGDLEVTVGQGVDATVGLARAEELYERVFFDYGDDSVAQLGGAHLACEQVSNLLTKVLERSRVMSYMEKSTRYVAYDSRLPNGHYRYYRCPEILASPLGARYVGDMDRLFDAYGQVLHAVHDCYARQAPSPGQEVDLAYRRALRAKAYDAARGLLPAAATANVGIYGSGQAYEALILRLRAHPLAEARSYAELMLAELRKVIPSWVRRLDVAERGGAWASYLRATREATSQVAQAVAPALLAPGTPSQAGPAEPSVRLVDYDPLGEEKVVAAMLYPVSTVPEEVVAGHVASMSAEERLAVMRAYAGERANRRHRPGRALERTAYRFEVVSDYGAFRDLQRHRFLTIEWQTLAPYNGYSMPQVVPEAGVEECFASAMDRSGELYEALLPHFGPDAAAYAVTLAYRARYTVQMNAREAMHLLELRTTPQGHPEYRQVCQAMHRLIDQQAGHKAIAAMMSFVDHSPSSAHSLGRLSAERKAESRRRPSRG